MCQDNSSISPRNPALTDEETLHALRMARLAEGCVSPADLDLRSADTENLAFHFNAVADAEYPHDGSLWVPNPPDAEIANMPEGRRNAIWYGHGQSPHVPPTSEFGSPSPYSSPPRAIVQSDRDRPRQICPLPRLPAAGGDTDPSGPVINQVARIVKPKEPSPEPAQTSNRTVAQASTSRSSETRVTRSRSATKIDEDEKKCCIKCKKELPQHRRWSPYCDNCDPTNERRKKSST